MLPLLPCFFPLPVWISFLVPSLCQLNLLPCFFPFPEWISFFVFSLCQLLSFLVSSLCQCESFSLFLPLAIWISSLVYSSCQLNPLPCSFPFLNHDLQWPASSFHFAPFSCRSPRQMGTTQPACSSHLAEFRAPATAQSECVCMCFCVCVCICVCECVCVCVNVCVCVYVWMCVGVWVGVMNGLCEGIVWTRKKMCLLKSLGAHDGQTQWSSREACRGRCANKACTFSFYFCIKCTFISGPLPSFQFRIDCVDNFTGRAWQPDPAEQQRRMQEPATLATCASGCRIVMPLS